MPLLMQAGRETVPFVTVPPQYTSKRCNACLNVNKLLKSEKEWTCPACGVVHDRDINAATNIAELGKKYFADGKKKTE